MIAVLGKYISTIEIVPVGTRILFVVALFSNLFIGGFILYSTASAQAIDGTIEDVLSILQSLRKNLPQTVVKLQNDFLLLPGFFSADSTGNLIEKIESGFL